MDIYKESIKKFNEFCFNGSLKYRFLCAITRNHTYYRYRVYKYYSLYKKANLKILKILYFFKYTKASTKINVQINCDTFFSNFHFNHINIVINKKAIIGDNLFCIGNNCIGGKNGGAPTIGNNVTLGYGATIIGNIKIADNVYIGAGAVVTKDVLTVGARVIGFNKIL